MNPMTLIAADTIDPSHSALRANHGYEASIILTAWTRERSIRASNAITGNATALLE